MSAETLAPIAPDSFDRPAVTGDDPKFELRFTGLFNPGRGYAFPCDAQGQVDLDSLSEMARIHYFALVESRSARTGERVRLPVDRPTAVGNTWSASAITPQFSAR